MLKLTYECLDCGATDRVSDLTNFDGCCPNCHKHWGNMQYYSEMSSDEFVEALANMSPKDIAHYATAIHYAVQDIWANDL